MSIDDTSRELERGLFSWIKKAKKAAAKAAKKAAAAAKAAAAKAAAAGKNAISKVRYPYSRRFWNVIAHSCASS